MIEIGALPPLPHSREELELLREWNLEMLEAWRRRKDHYIREYNILCRWGTTPDDRRLREWVTRLTWSPTLGEPDHRLRDPRYWFVLVEPVRLYLPQNRLWHCHESLRRLRENGINHNFKAGSNQLAIDVEAAVYDLFSLSESLEDRLLRALNCPSGDGAQGPDVAAEARSRRAAEQMNAAMTRLDQEAAHRDDEYGIDSSQELKCITKLLTSVPETWTEYDQSDLSRLDEKGLYWLVAAGMIERRFTIRVRHVGQPTYFDATITATGEGGFEQAMRPANIMAWKNWSDAWKEWMAGDNASISPFVIEKLREPEQGRLTDQGMLARDDLRAGNPQVVLDFVFKRGRFANRPTVRGFGTLIDVIQYDDRSGATRPSAARQPRPPIDPQVFPYPYGSDLHWLHGWGYRLGLLLQDDDERSECDWMIFRPDRQADNAMTKFSIDYPAPMQELRARLADANKAFDEFLEKRTPIKAEVFSDYLDILQSKIILAAALIAEREGVMPNPASIPKSQIRTRPRDELEFIIDDSEEPETTAEREPDRDFNANELLAGIPYYFVFVRYWPGFTEKFPYCDFDAIADADLKLALDKVLIAEQWRRYREILDERHERYRKTAEKCRQRQATAIQRTNGAQKIDPMPQPRNTPMRRFTLAASHVGWHEPGGYACSKIGGEELVSPTVWIAGLDSVDHASALVQRLASLRPVNDSEFDQHRYLNPRFGYVAAEKMSSGDRAAMISTIDHLCSNEPAVRWVKLVRSFLPTVRSFIRALEIVAVPPEPEIENGLSDPPTKASKKSWTQPEVNAAISKYRADRSEQYYELVNESSRGRTGAKKAAQKLFGRNVISKALQIPAGMVSASPEWQSIRDGLGLNRSLGKKGHFGKAIEDASAQVGDQTADTVERRETIRLIHARVSRNFSEEDAQSLIEQLQLGKCSDDNARQIIDTLDTSC